MAGFWPILTTYVIPGIFALIAGWKEYQRKRAAKGESLAVDTVDILTSAIELTKSQAAKNIVAKATTGSDVGDLIDSRLERLDLSAIRKLVQDASIPTQ